MKKVQVELVTSVFPKGYAFGETRNGDKVFIPLKGATTVQKIQNGYRPVLDEDQSKAPKYRLSKGMYIFAHLVPGKDGRLVAELWAPLTACRGEEAELLNTKVEKSKEKIRKPVKQAKKSSSQSPKTLSKIRQSDRIIKELFQIADPYCKVRVRDNKSGDQVFYGTIHTLVQKKTPGAIRSFENPENVFEIAETREKIWPLPKKAVTEKVS